MKQLKTFQLGILTFSFLLILNFTINAQSDVWVSAYYAGWKQGWINNGHLTAGEIDYSAVTHIIHFSLVPRPDGTLNADANSILEINSSELITRAHAEGKKVLISVGGWNSDVGFRGAASTINLPLFVSNLVSFMTTRGYDGIDIDWEPLQSSDAALYTALITALRTAINTINPRPLLTAAVAWHPEIIEQVHQHFDQINIMTYDYSGAWPGWVTWHNSPVYDGDYAFPSTGRPVPSADNDVNRFIQAGIPPEKLGIGIDFYGYVWSGGAGTSTEGVTRPRQSWSSAPSVRSNVPYHTIMDDYYHPRYYYWDNGPKAAYLSIDYQGFANDKFISYDDEKSIEAKFNYIRSKGIGGLIIWELGGGYRPNLQEGQRDILLQTVKKFLNNNDESNNNTPTFFLRQNYPNPFNTSTAIQFYIPEPAYTYLEIFNIIGQKVDVLVDKFLDAGNYNVFWNARNLPTGIYMYRLRSGIYELTKKMILMK